MSTTSVARGPESLEAVIGTVSRVAREEAAARAVPDRLLHAVAAEAVCFYWPRTVRTFIPVLALREVRAWLQYQPQYTATGTIRALSIVLAAHRFMTAEASATSDAPALQAATERAAAAWCGTGPEQAARVAFVRVAPALQADGLTEPVDVDRYVMLAAEVLAVPKSANGTDQDDPESEAEPDPDGDDPSASAPPHPER